MTKFMLQEVNINVGIGKGCSRPVGIDVEPLVFLQISHRYEFANRSKEFGPPNLSKNGVKQLPSAKVGTGHRVYNSSIRN